MTRSLPTAIDAERAVLGGLMLDESKWLDIERTLTAQDFHRESHQLLYTRMLELHQQDRPTEMLAVIEDIAATGEQDKYGGLAYLSGLPDAIPSTENLGYYASIVRHRRTLRDTIYMARLLEDQCHKGDADLALLLRHAEGLVSQIATRMTAQDDRGSEEWQEPVDYWSGVREGMLDKHGAEVITIQTGIPTLDEAYSIVPPDMLCLTARAGVGKTSLAIQLLEHNARRGIPGAFFSLEMPKQQLGEKMATSGTRVSVGDIRRGRWHQSDWHDIAGRMEDLAQLPFYINDEPSRNAQGVETSLRRLLRRHPDVKLVVVDYLGLLAGPTGLRRDAKREEQITANVKHLRLMARRLDVCVVLLTQLARECDRVRPRKEHLFGSSSIEKEMAWILALWSELPDDDRPLPKRPLEAGMIKARFGTPGWYPVMFDGPNQRFTAMSVHTTPQGGPSAHDY